jgi:hypothetical protein
MRGPKGVDGCDAQTGRFMAYGFGMQSAEVFEDL